MSMNPDYSSRKSINVSYGVNTSQKKRKFSRREYGSSKPKTILQKAKHYSFVIPVIVDGIDVTPTSLNPCIFEGTKERQINMLETPVKEVSVSAVGSASVTKQESQLKFKADVLQQRTETETLNPRSYLTTYNEDIFIESPVISKSEFGWDLDEDESSGEEAAMTKIPDHVSLILNETETMFMLDLPSCTVLKDTEEGDRVEEDNKLYEFLTEGKGRNRKVITVAVQTVPTLRKSRDTEAISTKFKHNSAFASNWDMYDTYNEIKPEPEPENSDEETSNEHRLNDITSLDSYSMSFEEKSMTKLVKNSRFLDSVTVIERLLANNCYNEQQKCYKGLLDPEDFQENREYNYTLKLLWSFANEETKDKCVVSISLNDFNEDLIAVGYGKYYFQDHTKGMVMIWNIKNPSQPERKYCFDPSVTTVAFSKNNPNLLAVGFYDGGIKILDVSSRTINVLGEESSSFEPVWHLVWSQSNEGDEQLIAAFDDGRVMKYQQSDTTSKLKPTQIMRTPRAEGKIKGITTMRKSAAKESSVTRYTSATQILLHPVDPFLYYVGTGEGVVHKCSINYFNQNMDMFKAHNGAVHVMRSSNFANKVYLTGGTDMTTRIWAHGINEPLAETKLFMQAVSDLDWSPSHASLVVSIRGSHIAFWDIQRKLYAPQTFIKNPSNKLCTACKFIASGRCVLVGDVEGNVHVYSVRDIPIPAFFPENLVRQSLMRMLVTKPDIQKKLQKLGSLNFDKEQLSKYFN